RLRGPGADWGLRVPAAPPPGPKVDPALPRGGARAGRWFAQRAWGRAPSLAAIASQYGIGVRYVGRLIRLAFLAPPLVEMIAQGHQPAELTAEMLTRRTVLPLEWSAQRQMLPTLTL